MREERVLLEYGIYVPFVSRNIIYTFSIKINVALVGYLESTYYTECCRFSAA